MPERAAFPAIGLLVLLLGAVSLQAQPVLPGADVLLSDSLHLLKGRRIGLVCNHATVLADGTPLLDRLRWDEFNVVAVFTPEHGFSGTASAGEAVPGSAIDAIPVHSLYGTVRKPTPAMLSGIDLLIFDLQDIGVRYYTYMSTLAYCIEAAAEAGIELLVLDRPNPLGGEIVEGPIRDSDMRSFVAMLPIPVRHGMTAGELARMMVGEGWLSGAPPSPRVIPLRGWRRAMYFDETVLWWFPPSPNISSVEAALAYVGTCLFEGSAISEGRGTEAPFLQLGAPFISGDSLADALSELGIAGVRFHPAAFTPTANTGARNPKYAGQLCGGVRIEITDRTQFRPFDCGLRILGRMNEMYGEKMGFTSYLDTLAGIRGFTDRCIRGRDQVLPCDGSGQIPTFLTQRSRYLLYR